MSRRARIWLVVAAVLGIVGTVFAFLRPDVRTFRAASESMEPTIHHRDRIVANQDAYDDADPRMGDIVVFHPPDGAIYTRCGKRVKPNELCPVSRGEPSDVIFVYRIVAGPGDRLRVREGRAIVDGRPLHEPYAQPCYGGEDGGCTARGEITIPDDHYFVMGDNRGHASDSRFWGPIRRDQIVGRVDDCILFALWCSGRLG